MLHPRLAVLAAGMLLAGTAAVFAQTAPTQLDRIEQKLDTILHRLDQMPPGQADGTPPTAAAATPGLSSAPETLAGGALAIIHAAPDTPTAAQEIPPDSVGGFIYTGGPLQLADLTDHGVRYAGLTGVEWQGWLRAREAGRYELDVDGSTVSANNFTLCPHCSRRLFDRLIVKGKASAAREGVGARGCSMPSALAALTR
jgi:hypothetical protein